jgi:hypothetical protein
VSKRRRRRHADPATLPRLDPADREDRAARERERAEREKAKRELDRVHDGLARAIAISLAAIVYFGVSVANVFVGFFRPPEGLELTNPLLLVGVASLVGATFLGRYLVRAVSLRRLSTLGVFAIAGLGVVLASFIVLFLVAGSSEPALVGIIGGLALSWIMASLWIAILTRRALRLLQSMETIA